MTEKRVGSSENASLRNSAWWWVLHLRLIGWGFGKREEMSDLSKGGSLRLAKAGVWAAGFDENEGLVGGGGCARGEKVGGGEDDRAAVKQRFAAPGREANRASGYDRPVRHARPAGTP